MQKFKASDWRTVKDRKSIDVSKLEAGVYVIQAELSSKKLFQEKIYVN